MDAASILGGRRTADRSVQRINLDFPSTYTLFMGRCRCLLLALLAIAVAGPARAQTSPLWLGTFREIVAQLEVLDTVVNGTLPEDPKRAEALARLYADVGWRGRVMPWTYSQDAYQHAAQIAVKSGHYDLALDYLEASAEAGMARTEWLEAEEDFEPLEREPRWQEMVERVRAAAAARQVWQSDPERARIVTADLANFWEAYDRIQGTSDPVVQAEIFWAEYVGKGSIGLLDFFRSKIKSMERLLETLATTPRYYASIRPQTTDLGPVEAQIRQAYRSLKDFHPEATFPDIYFVIGRLTSSGTVSHAGLLIGIENLAVGDATPLDELPYGRRLIVTRAETIPYVVAHELVHFQQSLAGEPTLLRMALVEGGADFLASLILPGGPEPHYRRWGREHEGRVWSRFEAEMNGRDLDDWIGNNGDATAEWPADLGYFIGYQVARAYYEQAADKQAAVATLLALDDPECILQESGYVGISLPR